jgi:hypothetical protein
MNTVNAVNILDSIVPISRFNKGEANKRLSQNVDYIPQEAVLKDPDVTEEDLKDVDVELE